MPCILFKCQNVETPFRTHAASIGEDLLQARKHCLRVRVEIEGMKPKVIELSCLDGIINALFAFMHSAGNGNVLTNAFPSHKEVIAGNIPKSRQGLLRYYRLGRSGRKLIE